MRVVALVLAAMLMAAGEALAQGANEGCDIVPGRTTDVRGYGPTTYVSGTTEFYCAGGIYVKADSAFVTDGIRTLIGNVVYRDSTRALTAQRVVYNATQEHINAQGQVVFTDRETGSALRSQVLDYWRALPNRPERVILTSGRPNALMVRRDTATMRVDTTIIDANMMDITGQDAFRAVGQVVIRRGTLTTTSQQADYNEAAGRMILVGQAVVQDSTMNLKGDSIHALLIDSEFSQVDAFRDARITSDDMNVDSDRLRIVLDTGIVQRLIAVGTAEKQAHAKSPQFEVTADSIDALAPGQKLDRAIAVGNAFGVRAPDSLDVGLPPEIARDWLRGDTVIAYFEPASDSLIRARRAAGDTTTSDRVLERLVASGTKTPATTLYRTREATDTTNQVSVIYTVAGRIEVLMKNGQVETVNATDEMKGLYLQPARQAQGTGVSRPSPADNRQRP